MKKTIFLILWTAMVLIMNTSGLRAEPLELNQIQYRSAIVSVFPDGYDYSVDDLLQVFGSSEEVINKNPPDQIHVKTHNRKMEIVLIDPQSEEEKVYKKWVAFSDLKTEVDQLINKLNGIKQTPQSDQKKVGNNKAKRNPNSTEKRTIVYRDTTLTIKGNLPDYIDLSNSKKEATKTTKLLVVFRDNLGHVYYTRAEDKLLRSLNKNIPLKQVKSVVDGFIDMLDH